MNACVSKSLTLVVNLKTRITYAEEKREDKSK